MQDKNKKSDLTRREFLQYTGAVVGTVAMGGAILTGCSAPAAPVADTPAPAAPAAPAPAPAATQAPEAPAAQKWDGEAEVLILGTGMAGLTAAIAAHQAGAKVMMLEKHAEKMGGNSIISGGNLEYGGTAVQKQLGVEDTIDMFYEDMMILGGHRCNPELARLFVESGPATVEWLQSLGIEFADSLMARPYNRAARGHVMKGGGGHLQTLVDWVKNAGIPVLMSHKLVNIIREEQSSGRVLGVEVETPEGTKFYRGTKGVMVATGGWKGNLKMRTAWDPRLTSELETSGLPHVETTGEGILAVQKICGSVTDMSFVCEFRRKFGQKYYQKPSPSGLPIKDFNDVIFINKVGERFVNETMPDGEPFYEEIIKENDNKVVHVIFDQAAVTKNGWAVDTTTMDEGYFFSAPTLAELAGLIGVPAAALEETVKNTNDGAAAKKDEAFGKDGLQPIKEAPFYAIKMNIYCHDQGGGIFINTKAQVLDIWGEVIEGLYAAGEATGGYFGTTRGHGKMSVHTVYGRIAGTSMASEK